MTVGTLCVKHCKNITLFFGLNISSCLHVNTCTSPWPDKGTLFGANLIFFQLSLIFFFTVFQWIYAVWSFVLCHFFRSQHAGTSGDGQKSSNIWKCFLQWGQSAEGSQAATHPLEKNSHINNSDSTQTWIFICSKASQRSSLSSATCTSVMQSLKTTGFSQPFT